MVIKNKYEMKKRLQIIKNPKIKKKNKIFGLIRSPWMILILMVGILSLPQISALTEENGIVWTAVDAGGCDSSQVYGFNITALKNINLDYVTLSPNSNATMAYLYNTSQTLIKNVSFNLSKDAPLNFLIFANESYYLMSNAEGLAYGCEYKSSGVSYPITQTNVRWNNGTASPFLINTGGYNIRSITSTEIFYLDTTSAGENLTFTGNQNITRYLVIPNTINQLTSAKINLTGNYLSEKNLVCNTNTAINGLNWVAQTFYSPLTGTISQVKINFKIKTGTPAGNVVVGITTTNSTGYPNGTYDIVNVSKLASSISVGTDVFTTFDLNTTILANTNYSIVIRLPDGDGGNSLSIGMNDTSSYARGNYIASNNGGTSWLGIDSNLDLGFEISFTISSLVIGTTQVNNSIGVNISSSVETQNINLNSILNSYLTATYLIGTNYVIPFIFHSDIAGVLRYSDFLYTFTGFVDNSQSYNSTTYETSTENYVINISYDTNYYSSLSANLIWNNIAYTGTRVGTGSPAIFTRTLTIPASTGAKNLYWNFSMSNATGTSYFSSETKTQTVNAINFSICGGPGGSVPYINFTFKDETTLTYINASIPTSTWSYWIGDGSVKKSYLFINNTENPSYSFCFTPANTNINIDYTMNYIGVLYPQRINNPTAEIFTNTTTNRTLYLSSSSDGVTDTTQVLSGSGQVISGVEVVVSREIVGVQTIIAQGTTGDDGVISFWLNPDFLHNFTFTKSGYTTLSTNFYPSDIGRTATMVTSTTANSTDCSIGTTYTINPNIYQLKPNTNYNFTFNLTSNYWVITNFGFYLKNASGIILNSTSSSTNGGVLTASLNTGNLKSIIMEYYYSTNKCTTDLIKTFPVYDDTLDSEWSINYFFTDLKSYITQRIFGLDNFGLSLIIFITMFILIGIMSLKFGFTSPGAISFLIFAVVLFFDVGVGILPGLAGEKVAHFITLFTAIIALGLGIREWQR